MSLVIALFYKLFFILVAYILNLINNILLAQQVPRDFKHTVIHPMLKNPRAGTSNMDNFRPISKQPFLNLSKTLENIVYNQFMDYLSIYHILEILQYGFKPFHSTKTALLWVMNDILLATDQGNPVLLVLLALTATFDTVDHFDFKIEQCAGLTGLGFEGLKSYLTNLSFCVKLGSTVSFVTLCNGVYRRALFNGLSFFLFTSCQWM